MQEILGRGKAAAASGEVNSPLHITVEGISGRGKAAEFLSSETLHLREDLPWSLLVTRGATGIGIVRACSTARKNRRHANNTHACPTRPCRHDTSRRVSGKRNCALPCFRGSREEPTARKPCRGYQARRSSLATRRCSQRTQHLAPSTEHLEGVHSPLRGFKFSLSR